MCSLKINGNVVLLKNKTKNKKSNKKPKINNKKYGKLSVKLEL
jgi:hypothetical protein